MKHYLLAAFLILTMAACSSEDGTTETGTTQAPTGGSGATGNANEGPVQN